MNREIKFRVWDAVAKRYVDLSALTITYDGKLTAVTTSEIMNPVLNQKNYILEQYTGLKDKNGKEICENDIVNLEYYEKPFGKKRWEKTYPLKGGKDINVVGFEDGYFKFHEEDKDGYGSELAFSDYGEWEGKDGAYKYVAEVIGNIHENKELLDDA